jgi:hypothetical protein
MYAADQRTNLQETLVTLQLGVGPNVRPTVSDPCW